MKSNTQLNTNYYNQNAKEFYDNTFDIDMSEFYNEFLPLLPDNSSILDIGCGPGRDSLLFTNMGYDTYAIDTSEQMIEMTKKHIGEKALVLSILDLKETLKYEGIWACASLLHLHKKDMLVAFINIEKALKSKGIFYSSFKYGNFEGIRNNRYFTDLQEEDIIALTNQIPSFQIIKQWTTEDKRPDRNEKWLNILVKKD